MSLRPHVSPTHAAAQPESTAARRQFAMQPFFAYGCAPLHLMFTITEVTSRAGAPAPSRPSSASHASRTRERRLPSAKPTPRFAGGSRSHARRKCRDRAAGRRHRRKASGASRPPHARRAARHRLPPSNMLSREEEAPAAPLPAPTAPKGSTEVTYTAMNATTAEEIGIGESAQEAKAHREERSALCGQWQVAERSTLRSTELEEVFVSPTAPPHRR